MIVKNMEIIINPPISRCCDMLSRFPELPKDPSFVPIPPEEDFASYSVLVEALFPTFFLLHAVIFRLIRCVMCLFSFVL